MQPASGANEGWLSWFRCIVLGVQLSVACAAASATETPPPADPNGAPRALTFQVHDPEQANERRLALVIGNSTYNSSPLANPANDGRAMATKLRQLGFEVMEKENATREDMVRLSREFG